MPLPLSPQELASDALWKVFHSMRSGVRYPQPRRYRAHLEMCQLFQKHLPRRHHVSVIEMGCGQSIWLPYLAREFGCQVCGVDTSATGLAEAQRNLELAGCAGELSLFDFLDLPGPFYQRFDIAISNGVIEHFEHPEQILRLFASALKPSALLMTWVPNTSSLPMALQQLVDRRIYHAHARFDVKALTLFHERAGLRVTEAAYFRWLDFSILNLSTLPSWLQRIVGRFITSVDRPLLAHCRRRPITAGPHSLYAAMYVIAVKP